METIREDAVCLGCGCLCDDIRLTVSKGNVANAENACDLGQVWFQQPIPSEPECYLSGSPASFDAACATAATLLESSRRPLVCNLAPLGINAQRAAVALADQLGGVIDPGLSLTGSPVTAAFQTHGGVSASLGEVAQRADVIVFWRCDPVTTHPRHFERFSLQPTSQWLPAGRDDRLVYAIGDSSTETAAEANHSIDLAAGSDYEAIATLRAIVKEVPLDADAVQAATGVPLEVWQHLIEQCKRGRYVAFFYDKVLTVAGHAALGALTDLMGDLHAHTRAGAMPLGSAGNAAGATNVLTWQTGFAEAVCFARGYPRTSPGEFSAGAMIARGEADVILLAADELIGLATDASKDASRIVLATSDEAVDPTAQVVFRLAPPGFVANGSVRLLDSAHRLDGAALPLRPIFESEALTGEAVLSEIIQRTAKHRSAKTAATSPANA